MKMARILYVVEGEIEKRFINQLTRQDLIKPGRVKKFNLMQKELKNSNDILTNKYDYTICVIDSDCTEKCHCTFLRENIKQLKTVGNVLVMVQNKNFEDELEYILQKPLEECFNLRYSSPSDIKKFLAQKIEYKNYLNKKHVQRYCMRNQDFVQIYESYGYKLFKNRLITAEKIIL
jgi:hypothetical protein